MTTTINASTSSGLVVTPDNSGNIVLQYNGVSTPAFGVYLGSTQSISNSTYTKINLNTVSFDTGSYFNTSTNRYTPLVAGYYLFSLTCYFSGSAMTNIQAFLYKNGTNVKTCLMAGSFSMSDVQLNVQSIIYINGTTDYIEGYGYLSASSGNSFYDAGNGRSTYMSGCLLRGA